VHFFEKCTPIEDFKKHNMVSPRKHSDNACFYSARSGGTRRLPKINHTVLGGLWDIVPWYPARKGEDLV
jgi:hypothetical protein